MSCSTISIYKSLKKGDDINLCIVECTIQDNKDAYRIVAKYALTDVKFVGAMALNGAEALELVLTDDIVVWPDSDIAQYRIEFK